MRKIRKSIWAALIIGLLLLIGAYVMSGRLVNYAIEHRQDRLLGFLLSCGAPVDETNSVGYLPIETAVEIGNLEAIGRLESRGVSMNDSRKGGSFAPIVLALNNRDPAVLKYIIEKGGRPDLVVTSSASRDLLSLAVIGGSLAHVKVLVEAGAYSKHRDVYGHSALDYAEGAPVVLSQFYAPLYVANAEIAYVLKQAKGGEPRGAGE